MAPRSMGHVRPASRTSAALRIFRDTTRGAGVAFRPASASHKLSPVRSERYVHPRSGRVFERPHAVAPFVASTYVSIEATCPSDCPMKGAGCYAQSGFTAPAVRQLDAGARGMSGLDVIRAEALAIDRSFTGQGGHWAPGLKRVPQDGARGGRDLRLHVAGDIPSEGAEDAARLLAGAARRWRIRGGGAVFAYTHQWHRATRAAWGSISVLASCDQPHEVELARQRGYAAALVVGAVPSERAFTIPGVPGKVVPCPAQTRGTTCAECRLCLDRDLLALDVTVAFAVHGVHSAAARERAWQPRRSPALRVIGGAR